MLEWKKVKVENDMLVVDEDEEVKEEVDEES